MSNMPLVGVQFRPQHCRDIFAELEPDDTLWLQRDPTNQYDANAIQVQAERDDEFLHIGFVAAAYAKRLTPLLEEEEAELGDGHRFEARFVSPVDRKSAVISCEFDLD